MSISKKARFEVFKRDDFRCGYCGQHPPAVVLEIDHINPKKLGGDDESTNLITSCFNCNRGKSAIPLSSIPPKLEFNIELQKEKAAQIRAYSKFIKKIKDKKLNDFQILSDVYTSHFPKMALSESFFHNSVSKFLDMFIIDELCEFMEKACHKGLDDNRSIKYFCGIVWKTAKER